MAVYPTHSNNHTAKSSKKASRKPSGDVYIRDPIDTDIIVPVFGQSGAGKSTFINNLLGWEAAGVGQEMNPETTQVQSYTLPHPNYPDRRLVIVDTPGFDSSWR